jgi:hypothetical protein
MSGNPSTADPSDPSAGPWAGSLEQVDARNKALFECLRAFGDPKQMQRRWFEAPSKNIESYPRSPACLEAMQRNLKAMTDLEAFQDQMVQEVARHVGMPLASDIFGLFERLHSVEHTILARLKAIEGRLDTIETKLGADQGHY